MERATERKEWQEKEREREREREREGEYNITFEEDKNLVLTKLVVVGG